MSGPATRRRRAEAGLCRDCESALPQDNPYSARCVECAVKLREYMRERMGARSHAASGMGRKPFAASDR